MLGQENGVNKITKWETTRCGRNRGSEEAHLTEVEFHLVGKWKLKLKR